VLSLLLTFSYLSVFAQAANAEENSSTNVATNVNIPQNFAPYNSATLSSSNEITQTLISTSDNSSNGIAQPLSMAPGQGDGSGWKYYATWYYNQKIINFTKGAISIVISAYIPWTKAKIAVQIANLYYQMNASNLYITDKEYRLWETGANGTKILDGEKSVCYFYSDKAHKHLVKTASYIHYKS
jgi:hypothetical protein